jgi:eukaryotic-like serine/threonine-protein kinase
VTTHRFIRCGHCGLPHEWNATSCPITHRTLSPEPRAPQLDAQAGQPNDEAYRWEHSIHPYSLSIDEETDPSTRLSALCGQIVDGKYRIEAVIGTGGMGTVYRAVNTIIDRFVAIKVLRRRHVPGSDSERRFQREARIAASIGHPNIVVIYDLGTLRSGAPYQVMELLEGRTLAARLREEGPLELSDVVGYAEAILGALEAAHERGVVHRDLKPDNVFLHQRYERLVVKLLDFGVSKAIEGGDFAPSITQTGAVLGTPYYLAPEQARGERELDHRVDLWSMGVLLYQCLTGVLPFRAPHYGALIEEIERAAPVPPTQRRPELPTAVEAVILKALAARPADRFASAAEMRKALLRAAASRGVVSVTRASRAPDSSEVRIRSRHIEPRPKPPVEESDEFLDTGELEAMLIKTSDGSGSGGGSR